MGIRALALAALVVGCSAPAQPRELKSAQDYERSGQNEQALAAYERAAKQCHLEENHLRRAHNCAQAHLSRAELLDRMGRRQEAAKTYIGIPEKLPENTPAAAEATYRAGRIYLELSEDKRGYRYLWQTITDYPDEAFAADALKIVVRDGRVRNAQQLAIELQKLISALGTTHIADNLLYALAGIEENELKNPAAALARFDRITKVYPKSGLRDDSLWHGARLARAAGDSAGAADRLRMLVATREVAFGAGSYFSVWLDDAQLELARILRDDLGSPKQAIEEFRRLRKDYPASILRDDSLYEEAVTWHSLARKSDTCKVLSRLAKKWPDSKYRIEKAPALESAAGCPATDGKKRP